MVQKYYLLLLIAAITLNYGHMLQGKEILGTPSGRVAAFTPRGFFVQVAGSEKTYEKGKKHVTIFTNRTDKPIRIEAHAIISKHAINEDSGRSQGHFDKLISQSHKEKCRVGDSVRFEFDEKSRQPNGDVAVQRC